MAGDDDDSVFDPFEPDPGDEEDVFLGQEHFEALGNVWTAFFGENTDFREALQEFAVSAFVESDVLAQCPEKLYEDGSSVVLIQYPADAENRLGMLVEAPPVSGEPAVVSLCPVFQGLPNELVIDGTHTWHNGREGVVAGRREDGPPVTFYAPYYYHELERLQSGEKRTVALAGLAFFIRKAEPFTFRIPDRLRAVLAEQAEAGIGRDIPDEIVTAGARMFLPDEFVAEWRFSCPVRMVEKIIFLDIVFYKLMVELAGEDHSLLRCFLYASESALDGYVPHAGDDVEGLCWMSGTLAA